MAADTPDPAAEIEARLGPVQGDDVSTSATIEFLLQAPADIRWLLDERKRLIKLQREIETRADALESFTPCDVLGDRRLREIWVLQELRSILKAAVS